MTPRHILRRRRRDCRRTGADCSSRTRGVREERRGARVGRFTPCRASMANTSAETS
jgi:hypothetical protein